MSTSEFKTQQEKETVDVGRLSSLTRVSSPAVDDGKSENAHENANKGHEAADNTLEGDIVYPQGITFVLILVSLLLTFFLTALDMVCITTRSAAPPKCLLTMYKTYRP